MMKNTPCKWEIWLAKVKFEDDLKQVKNRPVLVVAPGVQYILSLKITSHEPRSEFAGEYAIIKWPEAGLRKESTIRCGKRLNLVESDFVHKLGRLHPVDIINVQNILNENP